jgi:hypothetical protein
MSTREDWSSGMVSTTVRAWAPLLGLLSTALLLSVVRLAMGGLVLRPSIKVLVNPRAVSQSLANTFLATLAVLGR